MGGVKLISQQRAHTHMTVIHIFIFYFTHLFTVFRARMYQNKALDIT